MTPPVTILIAEDDDGHATLVQRQVRRASSPAHAVRLRDGQELLDYLHRRGPWQDRAAHPALLILLDLNMPRLSGFDVLDALKQDKRLEHIPVFVLTTTDNPLELERCYASGASACLVKPVDFGAFGQLMEHLTNFVAAARMPAELPLSLDVH